MQGFEDSLPVTVKDSQIQRAKQHVYKIILFHNESV